MDRGSLAVARSRAGLRRRFAVLLLVGLGGLSVGTPAAGAQEAADDGRAVVRSAAGCPDVAFIGARGSGEAARRATTGMGPSVHYMATRLDKALADGGETMRMFPVAYRAISADVLFPSKGQQRLFFVSPGAALGFWYRNNLRKFLASVEDGVDSLTRLIRDTAAGCLETDIVLGGYSQGAMVIHQAVLRLSDAEDWDSVDAILGTLLLADGDRAAGSDTRSFGTAKGNQGVRTYAGLNDRRDVFDPEFTASICNAGDIVCDFNPSLLRNYKQAEAVHIDYFAKRKRVLNRAVDWLAEELVGY